MHTGDAQFTNPELEGGICVWGSRSEDNLNRSVELRALIRGSAGVCLRVCSGRYAHTVSPHSICLPSRSQRKGSRAANARAEGAMGSNSLAVSSRSSLLPSFVNASGYRDVSATRQGLWFLSESMCRMHKRIALCKISPIAQGASRCASNNADSHSHHRAVHPLLIAFRMSFGGVLLFRRFCVWYCACKFQQFLVHGLHLPTRLWLYRNFTGRTKQC